MKIFFLRLFFILLLIFFEISFLDVIFPRISVPIIPVVSIVVWTLVVGFPRVLYLVIPMAVFFDIASSGTLGALTLYVVPLVYVTSFLSRRLLVEHHWTGMVLYALFASLGSFGYIIFQFIFFQASTFSWFEKIFIHPFPAITASELFLPVLLGALLFPIVYSAIRRFEIYISFLTQREILQVE